MTDSLPDVRFTVPGLPRGWKRTGQRIITPPGRKPFISNFTPAVTRIEEGVLREIAARSLGNKPPLDGPIDLRIGAFFAVPRSWSKRKQAEALAYGRLPTVKPDFDNISALVDAIAGVVWRDDAQVCDFHIWKRYGEHPRIVVEVRQIIPHAHAGSRPFTQQSSAESSSPQHQLFDVSDAENGLAEAHQAA